MPCNMVYHLVIACAITQYLVSRALTFDIEGSFYAPMLPSILLDFHKHVLCDIYISSSNDQLLKFRDSF